MIRIFEEEFKFNNTMSLNIRSLGVLFMLCISSSVCAEKDFYRAAVLELVQFVGVYKTHIYLDPPHTVYKNFYSPPEIAQENLRIYETAGFSAALEGADIIVFPECGLFPPLEMNRSIILELSEDIPNPKIKTCNPCKEKDSKDYPILKRLSCIAKDTRVFVVANMIDRKNCEFTQFCDADSPELCTENNNDCPNDGNFYYNTNVVFNREGVLVAKYYKRHPYLEPHMKTSDYPRNEYFETDFGNFTTAIGFDLIYKDLVDAVNEPGVANVAFSTYWFNHLPFLYFGSPIQQAFAMAHKVNVLASNVHDPRTGTIGSGIYSGDRGALIYSFMPDGRSRLLISNVPKAVDGTDKEIVLNAKSYIINKLSAGKDDADEKSIPPIDYCSTEILGEPTDEITDYRCSPPLQNTIKFVKLKGKEGNLEVCSDTFCCSLSYKAKSMNEEYFLGYTANPLTFHDSSELASEVCFVACCKEVGGVPCSNYYKLHSKSIFQKIHIKANFSTPYVYPFAVDSGVRLTNRGKWSFKEKKEIFYDNADLNSSIIFLGLHGRIFDKDKELVNE